ncbi:putative phosphoenolpyruvate synthase [Portunus trituberculatus]|uniref:Putative phosphoenolpyruvate synthase n=1 Tax=Portunus trituberculatus TaxID=210409 RepID=A0A5B7JJX6_PORTR|nr:putative phosphoenolpyruvate synthase [Portunus trituberculatus]
MINPETTRVAVRSSGCVEDGAEASAAGQNETVLGVLGRDNLLAAVTTCWASLFTYQSVEYRRSVGEAGGSGG